ncbi:hypothetical protein N7466_005422 [Penicillium verhagenii]|uniref:uncharacterized protein n=1 Tax=Penicillium verhagenii TaxID=1562060 RepID=UPI0025456D04|nr:uncharacterized protein N7466_005422 [Penicillium verhagenii]KAJ5929929.1 hypothetical protein N7466_005422 [Penicillium verhagenii]
MATAITGHFTGQLMRRAAVQLQGPNHDEDQTPASLLALFILSGLIFLSVIASIDYTYGGVVATLAAVEDSNPDIYVRIDNNNNNDHNLAKPYDPHDPKYTATPTPKPITSKLRTTVKHLRNRAGFLSRFRGLSMYLSLHLARGFLLAIIPVPSSSLVGQVFVQSVVGVLLSGGQIAWIHIVITEPSRKRFYQRIPSYRSWIRILPAVILEDFLAAAVFFLPMARAKTACAFNITPQNDNNLSDMYQCMAITTIPVILAFLIAVPARVIFIRVAASMLPEDQETIVPFDRSFGGKVRPELLGGNGTVGLLDAWKTFDWAGRVRFFKVLLKTIAMDMAVIVLAGIVLGGQILYMMPKSNPVEY